MSDDFTRELSDILPPTDGQGYAGVAAPMTSHQYIAPAHPPLPPHVPSANAMQQGVQAMGSMAPPEMVAAAQQAMAAQRYSMPQVSSNFNPVVAGYMDPSMNMAAPGMMTNSNYGVFRQAPVAAPNTMTSMGAVAPGNTVPTGLFPTPYGATSGLGFPTLERVRPELQFRRGYDAQLDMASEYSRVMQGRSADLAQDSGAAIAGMLGGATGNVVGTVVGGAFGGLGGSLAGGTVGAVAGSMAGMIPGVAETTAAVFRPAIERRADAIQSQFSSRNYLVGGTDLDISGTGLSTMASQRMMGQFDDISQGSNGDLNRQDVMNIMQASGEQGLLDFAQNSDQIAKTVKQVTSLVATMGEITGDPDFRENLKKIGNLKQLGFSSGEMDVALKNADAFSRMAGTDINTAMQTSGMQGAQIFQGAGLDAATGMQTGMFSAGSANLAVQSGAFDEQSLALYGGKSGVSQQLTELSASFAAGPMSNALLPYALKKGKGGKLEVDNDALSRLSSGEVSMDDAIREASSKFSGDKDAILQLNNRQRELTASATRQLGPEGLQQMLLTQGDMLGKEMGGGLTEGLRAMGVSRDQSQILTRMAESPDYFNNLRRQQESESVRRGFSAAEKQDKADMAGGYGFAGRVGAAIDDGILGGAGQRAGRRVSAYTGDIGNPFSAIQGGVSNMLARAEEDTRLGAVGARRFRGGNMVLSDSMVDNMSFDGASGTGGELVRSGAENDMMGMGATAELSRLTNNEGRFVRTARSGVMGGIMKMHGMAGNDVALRSMRNSETSRNKSARSVAAGYIGAYQQTTKQRALAEDRLSDKLGSESPEDKKKKFGIIRKASRGLAALAKSKNSIFGGQDKITDPEIVDALRKAGMDTKDIDKIMSDPKAKADFLAAAMNDMDSNTRAQFREASKELLDAVQGSAGEGYEERVRRGTAAAFSGLKEMGFDTTLGFAADSLSDFSEGERGVLKLIGESETDEDAAMLVAVALKEAGQGDDLMASAGMNTPAARKKMRSAQAKYDSMPSSARRSLLAKSGDMAGGATTLEGLSKKVGAGRKSMQGIALKDTMSQFKAVMQKEGISLGDGGMLDLMENVSGLQGSQADAMNADVMAAAKSGDQKAFAKAMSKVRGVGSDGLTLDGASVNDAATQQQKALVRATGDMAARFSVSTDRNTTALEKNTEALNKYLKGEGARASRTAISEP